MDSFSTKGIISQSWQKVKAQLGMIIGVFVVVLVVELVFQGLSKSLKDSPLMFPVSIAGAILSLFLQVGLVRFMLNIVDDKNPQFADLFSQKNNILKFFFASILTGLITVIPGLILGFFIVFFTAGLTKYQEMFSRFMPIFISVGLIYIVFSIVMSIRLQFFSYLIVDKNYGAVDSIKQSWFMTKGRMGQLLLLSCKLILLNLLGAVCLLVGLLVTLPLSMVAIAYTYRKLIPQRGNSHEGDMPLNSSHALTPSDNSSAASSPAQTAPAPTESVGQ